MPLRFTLRQIEYYVAVADAGSVALAAERLHVSSPSISAAISQLEAEPVRKSPSEMIRHIIEAGYEDYLQENFANYRQRLEDLALCGIRLVGQNIDDCLHISPSGFFPCPTGAHGRIIRRIP